jgi:hypothetical protein
MRRTESAANTVFQKTQIGEEDFEAGPRRCGATQPLPSIQSRPTVRHRGVLDRPEWEKQVVDGCPRSRTGSDMLACSITRRTAVFQSTLPHRELVRHTQRMILVRVLQRNRDGPHAVLQSGSGPRRHPRSHRQPGRPRLRLSTAASCSWRGSRRCCA